MPSAAGIAGALEVLQPPQVQPLAGQRVHGPDDPLLGEALRALCRGRKVNCWTSGACGLEQTVTVTRRPAARLACSCRAARSSSEIRSGSSGASAHAR